LERVAQRYENDTRFIREAFRYELWDEERIRLLMKTYYNRYLEMWEDLPYMIQKIDAAKV
jgi:mannosyltransferase OCH1-like enzyme